MTEKQLKALIKSNELILSNLTMTRSMCTALTEAMATLIAESPNSKLNFSQAHKELQKTAQHFQKKIDAVNRPFQKEIGNLLRN